ncbi:NAD(P)-binding protein [Trametes polyzona]|nr:NAD(P)-binding protein [Trametes polyzona]
MFVSPFKPGGSVAGVYALLWDRRDGLEYEASELFISSRELRSLHVTTEHSEQPLPFLLLQLLHAHRSMSSYVVTGASRGIGLEFVNQLSSDSKKTVFALARNPQNSAKLGELQKSRSNVHVFKADITDPQSLRAAAKAVSAVTGGTLDYLINNAAAVGNERTPLTMSTYSDDKLLENDLIDQFRTNTVGVVHTINAFLPLLRAGKTKKVITISTGVADADLTLKAGFAPHAPYCVSKAALNLVVAKYAAEFRDEGFTFLAISPGLVNTAEKPPTQEELAAFGAMVAQFKKYAPEWDGQPLTPQTSVRLVLGVIDKATVEDTGAFLSHWGNKQWL